VYNNRPIALDAIEQVLVYWSGYTLEKHWPQNDLLVKRGLHNPGPWFNPLLSLILNAWDLWQKVDAKPNEEEKFFYWGNLNGSGLFIIKKG